MKKLNILFLLFIVVVFTSCVSTNKEPPVAKEITVTNKCRWAVSTSFIYPASNLAIDKFTFTTEPQNVNVYPNRKMAIYLKGSADYNRKYLEFYLSDEDAEKEWTIDYSTYYACYVLSIGDDNYGFSK